MSVPEGKRGNGKFEVLVKALELATYTIKITKNPKTFTPEYQSALTDDIIRTAKDIYIKCWSANNIRVTDADKAKQRKALQESAILDTYTLTALVQLAKQSRIQKAKADECYAGWRNHASKGSSRKLLVTMDAYYNNLWKDGAKWAY